jgi:hypothetical protein
MTQVHRIFIQFLYCTHTLYSYAVLGSYCQLLFAEDLVKKKLLEEKDGTPDLDAYNLYEEEHGKQGGMWAEFLAHKRAIKDKERIERMQESMADNRPKHEATLEMATALKQGNTKEVMRLKEQQPGLFL